MLLEIRTIPTHTNMYANIDFSLNKMIQILKALRYAYSGGKKIYVCWKLVVILKLDNVEVQDERADDQDAAVPDSFTFQVKLTG